VAANRIDFSVDDRCGQALARGRQRRNRCPRLVLAERPGGRLVRSTVVNGPLGVTPPIE
jgi:hypothetical protein